MTAFITTVANEFPSEPTPSEVQTIAYICNPKSICKQQHMSKKLGHDEVYHRVVSLFLTAVHTHTSGDGGDTFLELWERNDVSHW